MRTNRSVSPNRRKVGYVGPDRVVQNLSHAMQALKLILGALRCHLQDSRNGKRIVGCELRVDNIVRGKQALSTNEVARICRRLRGVNRETAETALLCTLDLAVPV